MIDRLLTEEQPELALVATWAVSHRHGPKAKRVVERAFEVTKKLPKALQITQFNAIVTLLSDRMLVWLKETSMDLKNLPMTEEQRQVSAMVIARFEAEAKLEAKALAEGRAEGLAKGLVEGLAEGKQGALLVLLNARGLSVSEGERDAIDRCADPLKLDAWIAKAATASSVQEVLAKKPRRVKSQPTKRRSVVASRSA